MTSKKQAEDNIPKALYLLTLIPVVMFGVIGSVIGLFSETSSPLVGLLWGAGIGAALLVICAIPMFGWEWIKKEADEGKMRPYMLCGLLVAIAISGWFAWGLGDPTCIEQSDDPIRSSCVDYADDDFEVTSGQRWEEFWSKLPVTLIICLLIAYIAHSGAEKNRPKHFKSEKDKFSVGIFPETISVELDEDGNSYKYSPTFAPQYVIDVVPLDDFPRSQHEALETVESWHKNIVSAATKVDIDKVDYSEGEKQHTPYIYGSYSLKKDVVYYHLTLAKYGKIYSLSMYTQPLELENKADLDKVFFEFVDSFKFIKG